MATKSKNTKFIVKLISILLSVVLMMGAFSMVVKVWETAEYGYGFNNFLDNFEETPSLANCYPLQHRMVSDMDVLGSEASLQDTSKLVAAMKKAKNSFVESSLKEFREQLAQQKENAAVVDEVYDDEEYETTVIDSQAYQKNEFTTEYPFQCSGTEFFINGECFHNAGVTIVFGDSEEAVKQKLEKVFDHYVSSGDFKHYNYTSLYRDDDGVLSEDLYYYVVNRDTGAVVSNLPDSVAYKDVLQQGYALTVVGNNAAYTEELTGLLDDYYDKRNEEWTLNTHNCDFYLYIDTASGLESSNSYGAIFTMFNRVKRNNSRNDLISGAVMLALSLALAIYAFTVCGKRMENGKVKQAFIDYVPFELHLAVTGGIIFGLGVLIALLADAAFGEMRVDYLNLDKLGAVACAGVIWGLFLELVTSFIRICKSEKGILKNLLTYYIIKYLMVMPCKKLAGAVKSAVTYQPQHFKKQLIGGLTAFGLLNLFFVICILLSVGDWEPVYACLALAICIGFDMIAVVFAVRYLVNLDKIITAAHNRTVPQVNYHQLPNSLKTLVNSLQYTRQELNAAVNKAVRDERMRTELITNVSHDLKTPLTSIINYVDLLKGCDIQDENAKEYIAVLDEKGIRLKRLIDDLIEASKITSGVISLAPVQLSLNELAAQAVYERQQEFADNQLELVFKGDKGNVSAYADGNKTFRILENLLSNAKKYSAKGTRVYCDVYETQNFSIFEIKNISAQPLDISPQELTERFVRGDKSRTNEGNGLGLSIADNLCKAQRGHLHLTIDGDLFKAQVMLPKHKH